MNNSFARKLNPLSLIGIGLLVLTSTTVLSLFSSEIFPSYYIYLFLALVIFLLVIKIDFGVFLALSKHLYIFSLFLLILPLIIGQVTRGAIRWIPLGPITLQSSELVRPFLLIYFAKFLTENDLSPKNLVKIFTIFFIPFFLILIQPSLGVALLTAVGFLGTLFASAIDKKRVFLTASILLLFLPFLWFFLQPYQKQRLTSFIDPSKDPYGAGYNSIQAMIAVGSGRIFGRGLGEGVQTQLEFLPEKHTDFIFASVAEELGLVGSILILLGLFFLFISLIKIIEYSVSPQARAYVSGVFLVLFAQTFIHVGMNMGLMPVTGLPLPFVSAGGSALLGTTMALSIAYGAKKVS